MKMEQYKIKNLKSDLFSKGGAYCRMNDNSCLSWGKKGKIWTSAGAIRRHLQQYVNDMYGKPGEIPDHWMVTEQKVNDDGLFVENEYPAKDFYKKTHLHTK